jgi:alkylated DNA repair dioxygenase AlkB
MQAPGDAYLRYAITFGEVAVLHVGGGQVGEARRERGFSVAELRAVAVRANDLGCEAELVMVSDALPPQLREANEAATLVLRDGAQLLLRDVPSALDALLGEQRGVAYDEMFFDRGRLKHKRARHNVVFGPQGRTHSEDYRECTIMPFASVPVLDRFRRALPGLLGDGACGLCAEGNRYFARGSGIGFHGDSERKVVICLSLGASSVLRYHWRMPGSSEHTLQPVDIRVSHGDVYVMSEKATGWDWRRRSRVRVVHAAGAHALK